MNAASVRTLVISAVVVFSCGDDADSAGRRRATPQHDAGVDVGPCLFCADAASDSQRVEPGSCASNADCRDDEFCDASALFGCPSVEWRGRCEPMPRRCIEGSEAGHLCGCDGQPYQTRCGANRAKVNVGSVALCDTPELFACGQELCIAESICVSGMVGDVFDPESCRPRPDSCSQLTGSELCDCLHSELGAKCTCESVEDSDGTAGTMLRCDSGSGP